MIPIDKLTFDLHVPINIDTIKAMQKFLLENDSETTMQDLAARVIRNCFMDPESRVAPEVVDEDTQISHTSDKDTDEVVHNGKRYIFAWNKDNIEITETGDPDECEMLEAYEFRDVEAEDDSPGSPLVMQSLEISDKPDCPYRFVDDNCTISNELCVNIGKKMLVTGDMCEELEEFYDKYDVTVGNIGTVYDGWDKDEANRTYDRYIDASKSEHGRASNEPIYLMTNGEITLEYIPQRDEQPDVNCQECNEHIDDCECEEAEPFVFDEAPDGAELLSKEQRDLLSHFTNGGSGSTPTPEIPESSSEDAHPTSIPQPSPSEGDSPSPKNFENRTCDRCGLESDPIMFMKDNKTKYCVPCLEIIENPKGSSDSDCFYCGAKNPDGNSFIIGAAKGDPDMFVMVEGTGKMACSNCYPKARQEGIDAINNKESIKVDEASRETVKEVVAKVAPPVEEPKSNTVTAKNVSGSEIKEGTPVIITGSENGVQTIKEATAKSVGMSFPEEEELEIVVGEEPPSDTLDASMDMSELCPWDMLGEIAEHHGTSLEVTMERVKEFHPSWLKEVDQ